MNKPIKKIIAKEVLIFLGIIGIGFIIATTPGSYIKPRPIRIEQATDKKMPINLLSEKRITSLGTRKIYRLSEYERAGKRQEAIEGIGTIIFFFGYPIYLFVRLIIFIGRAVKTKKITKEKVIKYIKIAFSKDALIRVALILGILYLSISILKSCGFIEKKRTHRFQ